MEIRERSYPASAQAPRASGRDRGLQSQHARPRHQHRRLRPDQRFVFAPALMWRVCKLFQSLWSWHAARRGPTQARNQKIHDVDVQLEPPTGRARILVLDKEPNARTLPAEPAWRLVTWRQAPRENWRLGLQPSECGSATVRPWANSRHRDQCSSTDPSDHHRPDRAGKPSGARTVPPTGPVNPEPQHRASGE